MEQKRSRDFYTIKLCMDNFSTGVVTAARADVKTGLAVHHAELLHQNLFITIGECLGLVTKR